MRTIITEESVLKEGFEKYSEGLFVKKTLTGRQVRVRCELCHRFNPQVFNVSKEQGKLIILCPFERSNEGEFVTKTEYLLPQRRLKIKTAQVIK